MKYERVRNLIEVTKILFKLTQFLVNSNYCKFRLTQNLVNLNEILLILTRFLICSYFIRHLNNSSTSNQIFFLCKVNFTSSNCIL